MIIVAGDSWGCGVQNEKNEYVHAGLAQLLRDDGFQVVNLSKGGGSNFTALDRIFDFCKHNSYHKIDKIFIWQTEWTRDLEHRTVWNSDISNASHNTSKISLCLESQILARFYSVLSQISQNYLVPIYLIGGMSDVDHYPDFEHDYPGLTVACASSVNYVIYGSTQPKDLVTTCFYTNKHIIEDFKKNCKTNHDLAKLVSVIEQGEKRINLLLSNPEYFFPDGTHGNLHFHKIVYNLIKEKFFT